MDDIDTMGVVGAGQMGQGIAQVAVSSGYEVVLSDIDEDALEAAEANIADGLEELVARETMTDAERTEAIECLSSTTSLEAMSEVELVIEAVTEDEELKEDIFRRLDAHTSDETILASNTSSISITQLASVTERPDRVVGMHFMNPVPVMELVELIRGLPTSDDTFETTQAIAKSMGKEVVLSEDSPGFIVNRVLMPMINEAAFALMEGVANREDIDKAMKLGTNQPMGPLTLADFIGLDTCLSILEVLHDDLGDPKYRPCPLLRKHVEAGWLGKKSGRGFYEYGE